MEKLSDVYLGEFPLSDQTHIFKRSISRWENIFESYLRPTVQPRRWRHSGSLPSCVAGLCQVIDPPSRCWNWESGLRQPGIYRRQVMGGCCCCLLSNPNPNPKMFRNVNVKCDVTEGDLGPPPRLAAKLIYWSTLSSYQSRSSKVALNTQNCQMFQAFNSGE